MPVSAIVGSVWGVLVVQTLRPNVAERVRIWKYDKALPRINVATLSPRDNLRRLLFK